MSYPLDPVRVKVERARHHLNDLERAIDAYVARKPYTYVREYTDDGDYPITGVAITEEPPPEIGVIVGDFLHNLRSSLDYLARILIVANGKVPDEHATFPICETGKQYRENQRLRGMAGEAVKIVKAFQPYNRGKNFAQHPLWRLNRLANLDKHRSLIIHSVWVQSLTRFVIGPANEQTTIFFSPNHAPLNESDMDMQLQRSLLIVIHEVDIGGPAPLAPFLNDLLAYVSTERVVPRFEPFLDLSPSIIRRER